VKQARDSAAAMLARVRIADSRSVYELYAHQISGGMQQRVAIAMALSINPRLLVLDEPTTGLDATVEAEILELIGRLRSELAMSILFISHNLPVISRLCDRVGVLYAGTLIEEGPVTAVLREPRHPYTVGLLRCLPPEGRRKAHGPLESIPGNPPSAGDEVRGCLFAPRCGLAESTCTRHPPELIDLGGRFSRCHFHERATALPAGAVSEAAQAAPVDRNRPPLVQLIDVSKSFGDRRHPVRALRAVSLQLWPGETLGLVGESGSGKTTLARVLMGLVAPDPGGIVALDGAALAARCQARTPSQLKSLQIVFQNPDSALNRSHSVRRLIGRALAKLGRVTKPQRAGHLRELLRSVRLDDRHLDLQPRQLSGGLKQRVAIARAFAGAPRVVACDEPTSALDVSVQATIVNLLAELQVKCQVSYLLISHDLATVRYLSDRIAVLYLGRLMEVGPAERVFLGPHHPYTAALLAAAPSLNDRTERRIRLEGEIPSAIHAPTGCVFHTRCPRSLGTVCEQQEPPLHVGAEPGHQIRCHIPAYEL
jgi:peptide/nickel transport system ATP-binding protein